MWLGFSGRKSLAVLIWISVATIFYSVVNSWDIAQAYYFAISQGFGIGFGSFDEGPLSQLFTIFHSVVGAGIFITFHSEFVGLSFLVFFRIPFVIKKTKKNQ